MQEIEHESAETILWYRADSTKHTTCTNAGEESPKSSISGKAGVWEQRIDQRHV